VQGTIQHIVRTVHPQSQAEYERILDLINKLGNASKAVYIAVLVWWIIWLWCDEPGAETTQPEETP
jgi:hypothetical protein